MAIFSKKEKAEKQPENAETTAPVQEQQKDNGTATVNPPTPPPPPAEEKAEKQPKTKDKPAVAPINIAYDLKGKIDVTGIRVVNGMLIYNNGLKVVRVPVNKDKPVTITIKQ